MSEIETDINTKYINKIVNSDKFISYVDNDLLDFAVSYIDKTFKEYPQTKHRLSITQARGMLTISAHSIDKTDELIGLCKNRKKKSTNEETKIIWEQLYYLFDFSKDKWQEITGITKFTPKQFMDQNIPEGLTDKQTKEFKRLFYPYLMHKFCIHFYSHYNYMKSLKGEKS